jgi:hypothetical protein
VRQALAAGFCLCGSLLQAGSFSVAKDAQGRWNFMDPDGRAFFSKGVDVVVPLDSTVKPGARGYDALKNYGGDKGAWAKAAAERLRRYGFNSVGAWSDEAIYGQGLAFAHTLALAGYGQDSLMGVWSDAFKAKAEAQAASECAKYRDKPMLLGYFLDNELPWYGDTGWPGPHNSPLISRYLKLAPGPDRAQAEAELKEFYGDAPPPQDGEFPERLQQAFAVKVAERYFEVCGAALRKNDPSHLNLGVRFAGMAYDGVIRSCGRYCDVVSLNMYSKSGDFNLRVADRIEALSGGKPLLITEFSYRAMQNGSGDPNTRGADVTVSGQAERAEHLGRFLSGALDLPYLVGYHWFEYADEPPQGRFFDGEDSNYGLVDVHDREYPELRDAFIAVNRSAEARHGEAEHKGSN